MTKVRKQKQISIKDDIPVTEAAKQTDRILFKVFDAFVFVLWINLQDWSG